MTGFWVMSVIIRFRGKVYSITVASGLVVLAVVLLLVLGVQLLSEWLQ